MVAVLALTAAFASAVIAVWLALRERATRRDLDAALHAGRRIRTDIDARVAHERAASDWFSVASDAMPDPMLVVDAGRSVMFANQPARDLWRGSEPGGRSLIALTRSYELDAISGEVLAGSYGAVREVTLDGRLFRVHGARAPSAALLVMRDVSELQRLGRARRDFVANLSHELRTPLTAIRLLIDTARSQPASGDACDGLLDRIDGQVDALTQIAQEMYDLSLIESGRLPMLMRPTNLCDLAEEVLARLAPQADRATLELRNAVPDDVIGLTDHEQMARALANLVHNAIKFTPAGCVTVSIADPGSADRRGVPDDFVVMRVSDTGIGIPRDDLPRIFERFYKVDRARGQGGGTGLGLAIAKHIVEAHGGQIWARSEEGEGTTFLFSVPSA